MKHHWTRTKKAIPALLLALSVSMPSAFAWTDQTHMAIERAAGLKSYQNAPAPDVMKADVRINHLPKDDGQAHFFDADHMPTRADVTKQLTEIGMNRQQAPDGYLLGAIINATRAAKAQTASGRFDDYYYAVLGHYVGDLSMPLHLSVYDNFNRQHHLAIDQTLNRNDVSWDVDAVPLITKEMTVDDGLRFQNEDEVINEMLNIAQESYELAQTLRKENRNLTHAEAIACVNRSASFFRALMRYCGKNVETDGLSTYVHNK